MSRTFSLILGRLTFPSEIFTYITNDSYFGDTIENIEPDSNVLSSVRYRPPHFTHKLVRVDADLEYVVSQGEEWRQGKGGHEDGYETELENYWFQMRQQEP